MEARVTLDPERMPFLGHHEIEGKPVLPLAFGDWPVAVIWSVLNALLLRHRIRMEEQALAARRA